jgi:hypothetical protein
MLVHFLIKTEILLKVALNTITLLVPINVPLKDTKLDIQEDAIGNFIIFIKLSKFFLVSQSNSNSLIV